MSFRSDEPLTDSLATLQKYQNLKPIHESSAYSFENITTGLEYSDSKSNTSDQIGLDLQVNQSYVSEMEKTILRSLTPITLEGNEEITILGQRGQWANKQEELNWKGNEPISNYKINEDQEPEVVKKKSKQKLEYIQELAIRYLRPPTPPTQGEIIIQQQPNILTCPAPPLIIRQQPARPSTPEPLVIREEPPQQPEPLGKKIITISGKKLPPPPRKVIIERLAPLPSKPQTIIVERWLPYSQAKRKVIFKQLDQPDLKIENPKNVIVQWETPQVIIKKEVNYLGVVKANPVDYVERYGSWLKSAKELPEFVLDIKTPQNLVLAADCKVNVPELEGDLDALRLVDLDQEGLSEYKSQVEKFFLCSESNESQFLSFVTGIFAQIDQAGNGVISIEEAKCLFRKLKSRLGRKCNDDEVDFFLQNLDNDKNKSGSISLKEFIKVFEKFY
ncbi:hypothetical protein BpHYR1_025219 [Brachionus plicatilis]|uniref:EF-hand domain-containing protein n=1 Tax=Brachionus plicatilis TaxID=10195 RepID=A0A3M7QM42_BRAPC|nr:hypothetical protein BpHYR1_025219 [Brachionus plicatilis]